MPPLASTGSTAGIERVGEGREAETLAWGEGRVLRLLRDPARAARLDRERVALLAARAAGVPVPGVFGSETLDGRPGLVIERIDGPDLLSLLGTRPWLLPRVGRQLGDTHARVHATTITEDLATVHDTIGQCVAESELVPDRFRVPALERIQALPRGDTLCHWDFQPANLISGETGPVVIDWGFALRGPPPADIARTRLILAIGAPPGNASVVVKRANALARRMLIRRYMDAYRRSRPIDLALLKLWEPLVAIPRLTAGIADERERLIAIIETGLSSTRPRSVAVNRT